MPDIVVDGEVPDEVQDVPLIEAVHCRARLRIVYRRGPPALVEQLIFARCTVASAPGYVHLLNDLGSHDDKVLMATARGRTNLSRCMSEMDDEA